MASILQLQNDGVALSMNIDLLLDKQSLETLVLLPAHLSVEEHTFTLPIIATTADRISNLWSCEIMAKMTPKTVIDRIENISLAKRIAIGFGIFMEYSFLYRYGRTK